MHLPILLLLFQLRSFRHDELTNKELIYNWNKSWLSHARQKNATIQIHDWTKSWPSHVKQKSYWTKWFHEDIMESTFTNIKMEWNQHNKWGNVLKTPCHWGNYIMTQGFLTLPHELMASMTRSNLWFDHQIGIILRVSFLANIWVTTILVILLISARKIEITNCNSIQTQPMYGATSLIWISCKF